MRTIQRAVLLLVVSAEICYAEATGLVEAAEHDFDLNCQPDSDSSRCVSDEISLIQKKLEVVEGALSSDDAEAAEKEEEISDLGDLSTQDIKDRMKATYNFVARSARQIVPVFALLSPAPLLEYLFHDADDSKKDKDDSKENLLGEGKDPVMVSGESTPEKGKPKKEKGEPSEDFVFPWSNWHYSKHRTSDNIVASWDMYIIDSILSWVIWLVLALLVWSCCYPSEPELFRDPEDPVWTFRHNHFACFKRPKICFCSMCCPAVQWADTMHLAGFLKVYIALAIFFACALLNGLTFGGLAMYGAFTSGLILLYRQRLREKLGLKSWTCTTCFFDILYVCCCTCCAISQEAQVVRYAYQQGGTTSAAPAPAPVAGRVAYSSQGTLIPPSRTIMTNAPPVATQQWNPSQPSMLPASRVYTAPRSSDERGRTYVR